MTYLLVVTCAFLWALVLSAAWRKAREGRIDRRSHAGFGRSMWALRSNHEVRHQGGRWVLIPYKPLGQKEDRSALRRRNF